MAIEPEQQPVVPQPEGIPQNIDDVKKSLIQAKEEIGALGKAIKAASEAKDKDFWDRVGIFFEVLMSEWGKVEKEEKEVSEETDKTVAKSAEELKKDALAASGLDKAKVADEADQNLWKTNVELAVGAYRSLPEDKQGKALEAWKKLIDAMNGKELQPLSKLEAQALAGSLVITLRDFKKQFNSKEEFAKALTKLKEISQNTAFPFEKLMNIKGLSDKMPIGALVGLFGIYGLDIGGVIGSAISGKKSNGRILLEHFAAIKGDKDKNIAGQVTDEAVAFIKDHFFPNTDATNVKTVVETIQKATAEGGSFTTDILAELAFLISDADYDNLIKVLTAKE